MHIIVTAENVHPDYVDATLLRRMLKWFDPLRHRTLAFYEGMGHYIFLHKGMSGHYQLWISDYAGLPKDVYHRIIDPFDFFSFDVKDDEHNPLFVGCEPGVLCAECPAHAWKLRTRGEWNDLEDASLPFNAYNVPSRPIGLVEIVQGNGVPSH